MNILLIDGDENIAWVIKKSLEPEFSVNHASSAKEALKLLKKDTCLVLLNLKLTDREGMDLLERIISTGLEIPIVIITANGGMESVVEAMKLGAYDYLEKPFNEEDLQLVVKKALADSQIRKELQRLRTKVAKKLTPLIGNSPAMLKIFKAISRVAPKSVSVLILGEPGTEKDLVARALHNNSPQANGPFVVVNSASLPADLLEAELFGVCSGGDTSVARSRTGKIEVASGGTLFFDEIGEIPHEIQVKLLKVLENKTVTPIGSSQPVPVNVRFIAATNRDLERAVEAGNFLKDLYYRLNVSCIRLPALLDRLEDIPCIAENFLKQFEEQLGTGPKTFGEGSIEFLKEQPWPGNVQELKSVIKRTVLLSPGSLVDVDDLKQNILCRKEMTLSNFFEDKLNHLLDGISKMDQFNLYETVLTEVDRSLLTLVLNHTVGNQVQAARILGINRNTLKKKINKLNIKL